MVDFDKCYGYFVELFCTFLGVGQFILIEKMYAGHIYSVDYEHSNRGWIDSVVLFAQHIVYILLQIYLVCRKVQLNIALINTERFNFLGQYTRIYLILCT